MKVEDLKVGSLIVHKSCLSGFVSIIKEGDIDSLKLISDDLVLVEDIETKTGKWDLTMDCPIAKQMGRESYSKIS
jgi:hypothetical protein